MIPRFENTKEKFEFEKDEEQKTLDRLHNLCLQLESIRDRETDFLLTNKLNSFIKEIEKELSYQEVIIQELEQSINYINTSERGED